jgi:anti-anti-sigma factor
MELIVHKENETTIVEIIGRLDTITAPELTEAVKLLINDGINIIFDCEKLEYISSSGLRVVIATHKEMMSRSGKLIIRKLNREVKSVFDLTGFSNILNIE